MEKVIGIGGIFFKSENPQKLIDWYKNYLGLPVLPDGTVAFVNNNPPFNPDYTVWSPFPEKTDYFSPSNSQFMINFKVMNLKLMISELKEKGIQPLEDIKEFEYGKFAWIMDPEGNKIELWEPAKD
ncbi:MAG: VOC family protein [Bacteroidota bacterium]|nr:VOC family protein [Bacteroidota bacterium]